MQSSPLHRDNATSAAPRVADRIGSPYPGATLAIAVATTVVCGLGQAFGGPGAVALALLAFLSGSGIMLIGLGAAYPHRDFGPANTVTLLRLALVAVLVIAIAEEVDPAPVAAWGVPIVAALALVLDGVDGWLARRTGLVSGFGARFDMEVDCVLALVLSLLALDRGEVGPWVLGLGLARYAFWAASGVLPWLAGPVPDRWSRKAICVVQIATLVALASPLADPTFAPALGAVVLALVAWSFAVDVRHLHRSRR
jgi:phosphatidylglycerophosphate synthase